ncbi:MAG: O-antigen ligase family protein [Bacteroidota bacterium]
MGERVKHTGKALATFFVVLMILRIFSYFMISENPTITRIFKTGLRVALTGISFLILMRINSYKHPTRFAYYNLLAFGFYVMYLFVGFASLLWTTELGWSALQLGMASECVFFVWFYWQAFLTFNDQPQFTHKIKFSYILWVAITWTCIYFLIGAVVDPDMYFRGTHGGEVQRLGGWIINPNELGMLCGVGAASLYVNIMEESKVSLWMVLAWIIILVSLLLTQSRSSLIGFAITTLYFVMISGKIKLILPTLVGGAFAAPVVFFSIFVKEGDVGEVMSMTGRLPFWHDLLVYGFQERPMTGYGFMRIWHYQKFPSIHGFPGSMTHNTFLQILLNLGITGAMMGFLNMIFTFRACARERNPLIRHAFIGMFVPVFINSLTEFGIFGDANYGIMWWLFLIMFFVVRVQPPHIQYRPLYAS